MDVFDICSDIQWLNRAIASGEVEDVEAAAGELASMNSYLDQSVSELVKQIKNDDALVKAIQYEIDSLTAKKRRYAQRSKDLKFSVLRAMEITGRTKAGTDVFPVSIKNVGRRAVDADIDAAPEEFIIQKREVSKEKLYQFLRSLEEQGRPIPNWLKVGDNKKLFY